MMRLFLFSLVLMMGAFQAVPAAADEPAIYTSWRNDVAVGGYDVLSFYSGKPVEGKSDYSYTYKAATWYFANQANLDLFKTNPEAFEPQYGGYCAWAIAKGKLAKGSPKHAHVEDGKLYLNFNGRIKRRWDKRRNEFITAANARWPEILED